MAKFERYNETLSAQEFLEALAGDYEGIKLED